MGILGKILKAAAPEQYAKYKVKVKHYDNARHLAITFNNMMAVKHICHKVAKLGRAPHAFEENGKIHCELGYRADVAFDVADNYKLLQQRNHFAWQKPVLPELTMRQKIGLWREAGREGLSARALQAALDSDQNARFPAPQMELPPDTDDSFILGAKTIADTWVAKERLAIASAQEAKFKNSPQIARNFQYHTAADEEASVPVSITRGVQAKMDAQKVVADYQDNPAAYHQAQAAHYADRKPIPLPKAAPTIIPSAPKIALPAAVGSDNKLLGIHFDTAKMSQQFVHLVLTKGIRSPDTKQLRSELIGAGRLNYNHLCRTKTFSVEARYDAIDNAYWGAKAAASIAHMDGDIAGYAKHSADYLVAKGARMACFEHLHDLKIPLPPQ